MFIFHFRINNNNIRTHHHATQYLQLDSIAFTRTGGGKDTGIGILQTEPIKQDQGIIVPVYTIKNTVIRGKF